VSTVTASVRNIQKTILCQIEIRCWEKDLSGVFREASRTVNEKPAAKGHRSGDQNNE
jgi:hypothetical protein